MEIPGGCLCGGTRYVLTTLPYGLSNCHCVDCRRASGAPFVTWGTVPSENLRIVSGVPRKIGYAGRVRTFASCCGTPLFFEDEPDAKEIDVAIATLDSPDGFPPTKNIWVEDRLAWLQLDSSLPAFPKSSRDQT